MLDNIRNATEKDSALQILKRYTQEGWPQERTKIHPQVMAYWQIRNDISEED